MREAVRLNLREILKPLPPAADTTLLVAFIWIADREYATAEVTKRIVKALTRLATNLNETEAEIPQTEQSDAVAESSMQSATGK